MTTFKCGRISWMRKYYLIYESLQAGTLMGFGDFITQKYVEKREEIDMKRVATFSGLGLVLVGPVTSSWYRYIDSRISQCWHPIKRGVTKMVLDQVIMAPILLASVLSSLELSLGSGTLEGVQNELGKKFPTILMYNYKVWPIVQSINFSIIPVHHQVLFTQTFGMFWNSYLICAKNSEVPEEPGKNDKRDGKKDKKFKSESKKK